MNANAIVEQILPYERDMFLWLNNSHNLFLDSFMWIYSEPFTWIPLAVVAFFVFTYKVNWKYSLLFLSCIALLFLLCDQLSANVIKSFFERYRPSHHPDYENIVRNINDYKGGRYGFISAHAANGFGISMFISLVFRYRPLVILMFIWATITGYSRIYLGVHFISDVVGGMLLGVALGGIIYMLLKYSRIYILKHSPDDLLTVHYYSTLRLKILMASIIAIIITIFIISSLNFLYGFNWLY